MDDQELELLLLDIESDRVERKRLLNRDTTEHIRKTICAFANDLPHHQQPGIIFIGVEDDGTCAHLPITDDLITRLAQFRRDILPFPSIDVQKRLLNGCEVAVILVYPSEATPLRYDGRVWVRVGAEKVVASAADEHRLNEKRQHRDLPYDIYPFVNAELADLDLLLFKETYLPSAVAPDVLVENRRSVEHQLASLRFTTTDGSHTPTVLGILVIGKDPLSFLPGAYIQFLRITGTQLTDPIQDQKVISGPLPALMTRLNDVLIANNSIGLEIGSAPTDTKQPEYPLRALQQVAYNAVLHRTYAMTNAPTRIIWYNDRIEMMSPGGPYGTISARNFGQEGLADYRNPHLAGVMRDLAYVQRFGVGITIARGELAKNHNPPLEFVVEDTHVRAIIRKRPS